jgi:hypothetical protein
VSSPLNLTFGQNSDASKIGTYRVVSGKNVASLFGRYTDKDDNLFSSGQFSPYPNITLNSSGGTELGNVKKASEIHNDNMNDISIQEIVKYTSSIPSMRLNFADFAYLKNVGVYPNNRLMVARRFSQGVQSDLTGLKNVPLSTLVSWVTDENFLEVTYGEVWDDAEASFTKILNDIGSDVKSDTLSKIPGLGGAAAAGLNALPFPGFMEGIQYQVLQELGLTTAGIGNSPLGNPNLIREAKKRKTIGKEDAGSGLTAKFSIKMVVEYEQKFINGVDPTLVYLDIIQNALTFGTSDASFQFNSSFAEGSAGIIKKLISGDILQIASAIVDFVEALLKVIGSAAEQLVTNLVNPPKDSPPNADQIYNLIKGAFTATAGHVVSKYKVKLIGVVNALTGSPSAPWHIMIGNPKKPIFCSGDMLTDSVSLTVGKSLAFNDLPSYIKIEFTLTNARSLGASEIFNRFNTGKARSYKRVNPSYVESSEIDSMVESALSATTSAGNKDLSNTISSLSGSQADQAEASLNQNSSTGGGPTSNVNIPEDYLIKLKSDGGDDWITGPTEDLPAVNMGQGSDNNVTNTSSATASVGSTSTTNNVQTNPAPVVIGPPAPTDPASVATQTSKYNFVYSIEVDNGYRRVRVRDMNGNIVYISGHYSTTTEIPSDSDIIKQAQNALGDN